MTLNFEDEYIIHKEKFVTEPFTGFISPQGEIINFNSRFERSGHESWKNVVSEAFLLFISYAIRNTSIQNLPQSLAKFVTYPGIDEFVYIGFDTYNTWNTDDIQRILNSLVESCKPQKESDKYERFRYELLLFFQKTYKNKTFFETIGRVFKITGELEFLEKEQFKDCDNNTKKIFYRLQKKRELMQFFKDIAVMYLGYDSIERVHKNISEIKITSDYDFLSNPRIITTSCPNPNERFFNKLLVDWAVQVLPRYFYNPETQKYEPSFFHLYYQSEKEENLAKEIASIKRLVPLNERYKYFIK